MLHAPGGRIVFNRMCADEEPYQVKAYARMESADGRARAVAAVLAGYRATGGKTVFVDVRIQRLKLDAGKHWRNANYTIRLTARSDDPMMEGSEVGAYVEDAKGEMRFGTDGSGSADWITFVEPDDRDEDAERFHRFAPELDFTDGELRVNGPRDEFDLTLILRNETNGRMLELAGTPGTDTGTDMGPGTSRPQDPRIGGHVESRSGRGSVQLRGTGLEVPQVHRGTTGRQTLPGRVHDGSAVTQPHRRCQAQIRRLAPVRLTFPLMR